MEGGGKGGGAGGGEGGGGGGWGGGGGGEGGGEGGGARGVPCAEEAVSEAVLRAADEVWMTSSTKEILPITRLDGKPVGDGRPGPLHARLLALYKNYKRDFCAGKVD